MNPSPTDHARPATIPPECARVRTMAALLEEGPDDGIAGDPATTHGRPSSGTLSVTPDSGTGHELISTARADSAVADRREGLW